MYLLAREWGIQPSEFWEMTLPEWFVEYEFRTAERPKLAGNLTPDAVDELQKMRDSDAT